MTANFRVDCRFLPQEFSRRVERKYAARVERLWTSVLNAFKHRNELPYLPTIFVIPFYPYVQSVVGRDPQRGVLFKRRSMDACTAPDPDDSDRWAIYLVYGLVKRAYDTLFTAILAEELTHFYWRTKDVFPTREIYNMKMEGKSATEIYDKKEEEVKDYYLFFNEPVSSHIQLAKQKGEPTLEQGRQFCEGSKPLPQNEFYEVTLGVNGARKRVEKMTQKIRKDLSETK